MPTSPTPAADRPADQLRAAAERARETGDPLHIVVAQLLDRHAKEYDASVAAAANVWPDSADEAARWLAAQVPPEVLAVARQLLGTSAACTHCKGDMADPEDPGDYDSTVHMHNPHTRGPCPECNGTGHQSPAAPPAPADRAATRDRIRRAICEASGFTWLPDELMEPDEYGEHADAVLAVLADGAAAGVQPPTTSEALTDAERQFLTFAMDLAFDEMVSNDGFTDEDHAALDKFRALATPPAAPAAPEEQGR